MDEILSRIKELEKSGLTESEIAKSLDMTISRMRAFKSLAIRERRSDLYSKAKTMKEAGLTNLEIAEKLGLKGESSVRSLLDNDAKTRMNLVEDLVNYLKDLVDEKGMIDVSFGVHKKLGTSKEKMDQALELLQIEGYEVYGGRVPQATNKGKYTTLKVLAPHGTPHGDIFQYGKIHSVDDITSYDDGKRFIN